MLIPARPNARDVLLFIVRANTSPTYVYQPRSAAAVTSWDNSFGPVRGVEIRTPRQRRVVTGGGASGFHGIPTQFGEWSVEISAISDIAQMGRSQATFGPGNTGDFRWGAMLGLVCEFAIMADFNSYICRGVGLFNGAMRLDADRAEPIMRNVVLTRVFDDNIFGPIWWANLYTGLITEYPASPPPMLYQPPVPTP